ncbi:MAG TPA: hypothetical protein VH328_03025 [Burkholderiaceae bacterium]|nr:hypothetical protein [Burkholderiaceae bacterium]
MIVVAFIGGALALMAAAGAYWWHRNGDSIVASSRAALDDGHRRGLSVDEGVCLGEALLRHAPNRGDSMSEAISRSLWLNACLASSRVAPSFCEGVPPPHEFIDLGNWVKTACARQGSADASCQTLYQEVAKYCASPQRVAKLASSAT